MATLIFDIETAGKDWDAIPESTQYSLTKWIGQKPVSDDEKEVIVGKVIAGAAAAVVAVVWHYGALF